MQLSPVLFPEKNGHHDLPGLSTPSQRYLEVVPSRNSMARSKLGNSKLHPVYDPSFKNLGLASVAQWQNVDL